MFKKYNSKIKTGHFRDVDATIVVEVELSPGGGGTPKTRFSGQIPVTRPIFNDTFELWVHFYSLLIFKGSGIRVRFR